MSHYLEKSKRYKGFHYTVLKPEMLEYLHSKTLFCSNRNDTSLLFSTTKGVPLLLAKLFCSVITFSFLSIDRKGLYSYDFNSLVIVRGETPIFSLTSLSELYLIVSNAPVSLL